MLTRQQLKVHNDCEIVQIGDFVLWSLSPREAWTEVAAGSPFVGVPVATLRERHGQPALQFGRLKITCQNEHLNG